MSSNTHLRRKKSSVRFFFSAFRLVWLKSIVAAMLMLGALPVMAAVPTVTGISPSQGPIGGGTTVTITGSDLMNPTMVLFGAVAANVMSVSPSSITVTAPQGAAVGLVDVVVTTAGGTSNMTASDLYTYTSFAYAPSNPANGTVGVPYSTTSLATASGGTAPYTYTVSGTLPIGLTLDPSGTLHGTPVSVGTATFQVRATDNLSAGGPYSVTSASVTMSIVAPTISFNLSSLPDATAGVFYSQTLQASGGTAPYTYSIAPAALPAGLSWNPTTGVISGTPTQVNTGTLFTVTATDANSSTGSMPLILRIAPPILSVTPNVLPNAVLGASYSQVITGSGGNTPYTFSVTGLPNGVTATSAVTGVTISGTPTAAGVFSVEVKITDSTAGTGAPFSTTQTLSLTVSTTTVAISPATLPVPVAGETYSQTISASNGIAPYRYTVTAGALPAGLSLNPATGIISGTATGTGASSFTVTATDSSTGMGAPLTASQSYSFNVTGQVASAPAVQKQTLSTTPITFSATANAVGGPFSRVAIATPPTSGTAVVSGENIVYTPASGSSGDITFSYTLTNAIGTSAPINVTITVQAVPVTAAALSATVAANGTAELNLTVGATGGPFTAAAVVSVSPASAGSVTIIGTTASAGVARAAVVTGNTYTLRFVPAAAFAGTATVMYTLSNAAATSVPGAATITVSPRKDPSTDPDVTGLIGSQVEAARRFATSQISNYNQRLQALHGTGRAPSRNSLNVELPANDPNDNRSALRCSDTVGLADRNACLRNELSQNALRKEKDRPIGQSGMSTGESAAADDGRLAWWANGTADFGLADTTAQRSGVRFTTGGLTLGADYRFSDQLSLGVGVGYGHESSDIGNAGTRNTADSYSGALYASYRPMQTVFVDAVLGMGKLNFNSLRWVSDANDFASGKRNGRQFFGSLSAGLEYRTDAWLFSPYGRLTASRSTLDQYSETGAGLNALTYFKQNVNTLSGALGVRSGFNTRTRLGTLSPYLSVELQHDFNGQSMAGLAYADIASNGPLYFVPGTPYDSNRIQIGAGMNLNTGNVSFGFDYSVTTGMGVLQQGVRLSVSGPF